MQHLYHLTLTEEQALDLRLGLMRAYHSLDKLVADYIALGLNREGFDATISKYKEDRDNLKIVMDAAKEAWDDLLNRKEAQGTLEQAAWHDTSAELN